MASNRTPYICLKCKLHRRFQNPGILRRYLSTSASWGDVTTPASAPTPRPPTAPKPIPNVKHIRQYPDLYAENCKQRNYDALAEHPFKIQRLSEEAAELDRALKAPRAQIKSLESSMARIASSMNKKGKELQNKPTGTSSEVDDTSASSVSRLLEIRQDIQKLREELEEREKRWHEGQDEIQRLALVLPNLTSPATPVGKTPRLVEYLNFDPQNLPAWVDESGAASKSAPERSHVSIGTKLELLDFASAANSTGWGWYYLINEGALLEHALVQYALSVALRRGWKAVSPPSLVYSYISEACGFQPRDQNNEQQVWHVEQSERERGRPQRSLSGTAEIPLAAMHTGRMIDASALPLKYVGASRCYRAEAGARGVDTKGLYRVHEFTKVELFGWTDPSAGRSPAALTESPSLVGEAASSDPSDALFAEVLEIQTEILSGLNLPCRILEMPTHDLGASAYRKRDIEVLFPSRLRQRDQQSAASDLKLDLESAWGEVTSASVCTDYQSRRLGTRVTGGKMSKSRYPHSINATAVAVPRILAALLEHGWNQNRKSVVLPKVLQPWMGGMEEIRRK